MAPAANPGLVALLRRWTLAAENAQYSSGQAQTFRKAARSLAAHPDVIGSAELPAGRAVLFGLDRLLTLDARSQLFIGDRDSTVFFGNLGHPHADQPTDR